MSAWSRRLPWLWSTLLVALLLGPALGTGYVLTYDLVWVPDLGWRGDFLGLSSGLPRAVPSDAVVSVLDEIVPGQLLEKMVLVGALLAAGIGTARLVPAGRGATFARVVAVTGATWNPFVVERLLIGHWPVLVGYGVLPWVIGAARRWRFEGHPPALLFVLVPLGSLSASAGLVTAVALAAFALVRDLRRWATVAGLVLAANAPWLVAGLLHAPSALSDGPGAEAFALSGEGSLPAPLAALSLGGIWNSEVVPASRTGFQAWLALAFLLGLGAAGARSWWRQQHDPDARAYVGCWALGLAVPLVGWVAPDLVGWAVSEVPGAGVVRDGSRTLALCAPLTVLVVAEGARVVWRRLSDPAALRVAVGATIVVLPIALMPDAAWGVSNRLRPAEFPTSWEAARDTVDAAHRAGGGDVLVLPLTSYRQPDWLDDRKVLDPIGRYLTPGYVASDDLVVSTTTIPGEDPRVQDVREALDLPTAGERARELADLGIGYVVLEPDAAGPAPDVAGRVLLDLPDVRVTALADVRERAVPATWTASLAVAWVAFVGSPLVGLGLGLRRSSLLRR